MPCTCRAEIARCQRIPDCSELGKGAKRYRVPIRRDAGTERPIMTKGPVLSSICDAAASARNRRNARPVEQPSIGLRTAACARLIDMTTSVPTQRRPRRRHRQSSHQIPGMARSTQCACANLTRIQRSGAAAAAEDIAECRSRSQRSRETAGALRERRSPRLPTGSSHVVPFIHPRNDRFGSCRCVRMHKPDRQAASPPDR